MGNWSVAEDFCIKLELGVHINTTYYNDTCTAIAPANPGCTDGFIACGDGTCEFPEECSSCSADCGACTAAAGGASSAGGCLPEWSCSEWSGCIDGTQARTCINSRPYCNVNKPAETQSCVMAAVAPAATPASEAAQTPVTAPITGAATAPTTGAGITGAFIGALKTPAGIAITFVIVVSLIGLAFPATNYIRSRKAKAKK